MKRCRNSKLIIHLDSLMAHDSGTGNMYEEQAVLLFQVMGKIPARDARKMVQYGKDGRLDLLDWYKRRFFTGALEQGMEMIRIASDWYRLAFICSRGYFTPSNEYVKQRYEAMSLIYDDMDDRLNDFQKERLEHWDDMIHVVKMIKDNIEANEGKDS